MQLPETLRSAGARVVLITGFYKHLAPLEPERCLVAASRPRYGTLPVIKILLKKHEVRPLYYRGFVSDREPKPGIVRYHVRVVQPECPLSAHCR
jgi:hypothetical protein